MDRLEQATQQFYDVLMNTTFSTPINQSSYTGATGVMITPQMWIVQYINAPVTYFIKEGILYAKFPGGHVENYQHQD